MVDKIKKNKDCFKILFQSTNPQLFRTTSIGYLYEIAQKHRVVLLTVKIDFYTKKILCEKSLFPGLEKIIFFEPPFYGDIFRKNYRLRQKSKKILQDYIPDIVIVAEDIWPMGLYLLRFAKRAGAIMFAIQDGFRIAERKKLFLWSCLTNVYIKMPRFLPYFLRLFFVKMKKYFGHLFYYWILPLTAGEMPFPGKTSFVFWDTSSGLRDADYSAVFSERDYDICVKDGVNPKKLFVIGHPLEHKSAKKFFEKTYFSQSKEKENPKTLTIMWPDENIGFREKDCSLIGEDEMRGSRFEAAKLISKKLANWKIFIKPHPSEKQTAKIKEFLGRLSNVEVVEPTEPADKYITISQVIIGFPPPSTTLFTASLQSPEKIILYLDMNHELLGDSYKDFDGVEYIDKEERLIEVLDFIERGTYQKQSSRAQRFDFANAAELIDYLYAKRVS